MQHSYFSPQGRVGRLQFLRAVVVHFVLASMLLAGFAYVRPVLGDDAGVPLVSLAGALLGWMSFCQLAKRLHDRGKAGWYAVHALHPPGILWLSVECGFLAGTPGTNAYGRAPGQPPAQDLPMPNARTSRQAQANTRAWQNRTAGAYLPPVNATALDFPERKPTVAPIFGWRRN